MGGGGRGAHPRPRFVSTTARRAATARWRGSGGALVLELLAVACALWLVGGLWGPGVPKGLDTLAHMVRTDFGLREIFGRGHLDGWSPGTGLGSEIFLFYGPGLALFTGLLRVASLGILSTPGAFKALLLFAFLALPLAVAYLARGFGLSRRVAGLAGILSLAVSSVYGPGLEGTFTSGLAPAQVSAPLVLVALGTLVRLWLRPRPALVVPLALSVAAVIVTHPISAVIFAVLGATIVVLLLVERTVNERFEDAERRRGPLQLALPGLETFGSPPPPRTRDGVVLSALAAAVSGAFAAFWLLPFLAHRELQGDLSGWETPTLNVRLQEVLDGKVLFRPDVAFFVVAAMVVALLLEPERRGRLAIVMAPLAYLFLAHEVQRRYPFNEIALQLPNRGLGYAGLLSVLPLAVVLDRLGRALARWLGRAGYLLVAGAALAIAVWPMAPLRNAASDSVARPAMAEAARELRRLVPEHARFATERQHLEVQTTNVVGPPFWLALRSGRNVVNAFAPETTTAPEPMFVGDSMTTDPPEKAADRLARAGVTHIVTTSETGAAHFRGSARFVEVWKSGLLTILSVRPSPDRPEPASQVSTDGPTRAEVLDHGNEHLRVRTDGPGPVTATLAVAWSPKWHARLDGRPVRLERAPDGLLVVRLPAGRHELGLDFRRDVWDRLGAVATAATVTAGVWLLLRRRGREEAKGPARARRH